MEKKDNSIKNRKSKKRRHFKIRLKKKKKKIDKETNNIDRKREAKYCKKNKTKKN